MKREKCMQHNNLGVMTKVIPSYVDSTLYECIHCTQQNMKPWVVNNQ